MLKNTSRNPGDGGAYSSSRVTPTSDSVFAPLVRIMINIIAISINMINNSIIISIIITNIMNHIIVISINVIINIISVIVREELGGPQRCGATAILYYPILSYPIL